MASTHSKSYSVMGGILPAHDSDRYTSGNIVHYTLDNSFVACVWISDAFDHSHIITWSPIQYPLYPVAVLRTLQWRGGVIIIDFTGL